jgi:hypothetical protein
MASPSVRLPADLGAAQRRVESWRSKSNGLRRPLPEWVWDLAADLVPSHGVYRVSRVLRLEYHKVKERAKTRQSARQKVSKRSVTKRKKPVPEPPAFVEVSAPPGRVSSRPRRSPTRAVRLGISTWMPNRRASVPSRSWPAISTPSKPRSRGGTGSGADRLMSRRFLFDLG